MANKTWDSDTARQMALWTVTTNGVKGGMVDQPHGVVDMNAWLEEKIFD